MMVTLTHRTAASLALAFSITAAGADVKPLDPGATLFTNVHVVSMAGPGVQRNHAVLVRNGVIEAVAPAADLKAPEGAATVDGRGTMYLIPGLTDMHLHIPPAPGEHGDSTWRTLSLLVVNGVTTVRGMAGHPSHPALRDRVHAGAVTGPTMYVAGPAMHIGAVKTPEDAAAKVKEHKEAGFDLIKAHHLPAPAVFEAMHDAANEAGIAVGGHVANDVGLDRAIARGQQIEHLDAFFTALAGEKAAGMQFGQFPPSILLDAISDEAIAALADRMAKARIWNTPTLALFARAVDVDTPTAGLRALPEMRYIHDQALDAWSNQREGMIQSPHFHGLDELPAVRGRIVKALRKAGAPIMAGSDCPQAFLAPGFALHDELAALAAAGLTPWEALETATANPARYLATLPNRGSATGVAPGFGTIEPGKRADLVLLSADPTADIANTRTISGVMLRGKWLDRAALDAMLADIAESVGKAG